MRRLLSVPAKGFAKAREFLRAETEATGLPLGTLLAVAFAFHVVVLLLALNPLHPDEHFQILEFAWARAGRAPVEALPWEFAAQIRPTLQPALALGFLEVLGVLGITSPFPWMLLLRLGTLAVSMCVAFWVFAKISQGLDRRGRQVLWLSGALLWYAPLLMFRFSSENLGGLALIAAIPLVEAENGSRRSLWWAGMLLGLSFVFRFQMAFAIVAILLWMAMNRHKGFLRAVQVGVVAAAVVAASSLVDVWFYGEWVFTPWLYLKVNLLDGVASSFGTSPWYSYVLWAPLVMAPPLSLVVLTLVGVGLLRHRHSAWTWAFVAFFVGHSLIAHKEVRFLFPLLYFVPVLAARGADALTWSGPFTGWRRVVVASLAALNIILMLILATPAPYRQKSFDPHYMRWLWEAAQSYQGEFVYVLLEGGRPYLREPLEANVYRHPRVRGIAHEPGAPVPAEVPPNTPPNRLLLITPPSVAPAVAGAETDLAYEAEPGYRIMARRVGLADTWFIRWLEDVDGWTDSESPRRVYRVHVEGVPQGGGP